MHTDTKTHLYTQEQTRTQFPPAVCIFWRCIALRSETHWDRRSVHAKIHRHSAHTHTHTQINTSHNWLEAGDIFGLKFCCCFAFSSLSVRGEGVCLSNRRLPLPRSITGSSLGAPEPLSEGAKPIPFSHLTTLSTSTCTPLHLLTSEADENLM